jgi:hypothetical protein
MQTIIRERVCARWILTVFAGTVVFAEFPVARADLIYNVTAQGSNDFVPFENDGTPNRPLGDHLGNQITFAGTARYLDHVQAVFASIGPKEIDTYTLDLFKNDGPIDPKSGLHEPGTLIAQFVTQASNVPLPGNGGYGVDWNFNPTLVPNMLTAIVSSSYSTTTPGQLMGPFAAVLPPLTGSALNTIWYGDGTPGNWQANNTWAINDGGATNYFDMRFDALQSVPEPSSMCLLTIGAGGGILFALRRSKRKTRRATSSARVGHARDTSPLPPSDRELTRSCELVSSLPDRVGSRRVGPRPLGAGRSSARRWDGGPCHSRREGAGGCGGGKDTPLPGEYGGALDPGRDARVTRQRGGRCAARRREDSVGVKLI